MRTLPLGGGFNVLLAQTARLVLVFSLLLALGIILGVWFHA